MQKNPQKPTEAEFERAFNHQLDQQMADTRKFREQLKAIGVGFSQGDGTNQIGRHGLFRGAVGHGLDGQTFSCVNGHSGDQPGSGWGLSIGRRLDYESEWSMEGAWEIEMGEKSGERFVMNL